MDSQNTPSRPPLLIPRSERRRFLISFTGLTIAGFAVGWILTIVVGQVIDRFVLSGATRQALPGSVFKEVSIGLLFGATLGTAQWFELRRHVESSHLWIVANSVGYVTTSRTLLLILLSQIPSSALEQIPAYIFSLLPASINHSPAGFIPLIVLAFLVMSSWAGIVIGTLQWLVLRRSLQSVWWWVFTMIASSTIASILGLISMIAARFVPSASVFEVLRNLAIVTFAIQGTAHGVIQSVSLCACRRKIARIRS
jgi:hypothetical protein